MDARIALALDLKAQGRPVGEVAKTVGVDARTVRRWAVRYGRMMARAAPLACDAPQTQGELFAMLRRVVALEAAALQTALAAGRAGNTDNLLKLLRALALLEGHRPPEVEDDPDALRQELARRLEGLLQQFEREAA